MTPMHTLSVFLRGARITKRGRHVVSFNAAMGMVFQGAAALALGVTFSSLLPQAAWSNQCGVLSGGAAGGTVTCDLTTYTGEGDGTADVPGTRIFYAGTWTQDTTLTVDELVLQPAATHAIALQSHAGSGTAIPILDEAGAHVFVDGSGSRVFDDGSGGFVDMNGDPFTGTTFQLFEGITSSIVANDGVSIETYDASRVGIFLADASRTSAGSVMTLNGNASVSTSGSRGYGAWAYQTGTNATGDLVLSLNDNASIHTTGSTARGAYGDQSALHATGDVVITLNDSATVATEGYNADAVYARQYGTNQTGDIVVTLNDRAEVSTAGMWAIGAVARQWGDNATGDIVMTLNDSASISTTGPAVGVYAWQSGADAAGDMSITVNDNASISTENYSAQGVRVDQQGQNASGNIGITLNGEARISTLGVGAQAALARQLGTDGTGDVAVTLNDSVELSTEGPLATGVTATSGGLGEVHVSLNDNVAVTTSGGDHGVYASVIRAATVPLEDSEGARVQRAVLDTDGNPALDENNEPVLADVSIHQVHNGANSATITMSGGTVSTTGDKSEGLYAFNENLSGSSSVNFLSGTVSVSGDEAAGLRAEISAPQTIEIDSDTGLALYEPVRDRDGNIFSDLDGNVWVLPVYVQAPERRVDEDGNPLRSTGTAAATVGANASVMATGAEAIGIKVDHAGIGDVEVDVAGAVTASGTGARGVQITGDLIGAVDLGITGTVRGGQGADAYSVFIDTGTGTQSTTTIGAGAQLGTADRLFSGAIDVGGGSISNSGTIFGAVRAGSLLNAASGNIVLRGSDAFQIDGNVTNNGVIDAADGAAGGIIGIGGDLAGNGVIKIDTDFAAATTDRITVGGNIVSGSNVSVDVTNLGGTIGNDSAPLLAQILTVDGTVAADSSYVVKAGLLEFEFDSAGGVLSAPVIKVADEVQVYTAAPVAVASSFTSIGSTQSRLANRVYTNRSNTGSATIAGVSSKGTLDVQPYEGVEAWASITAEQRKSSRSTGAIHDDTYEEIEGGYDTRMMTADGDTIVIGGSAHIGQFASKVTSPLGRSSRSSGTGFGIGASATYFASTGSYLDANLRASSAKSDISRDGTELASDVKSRTVSGSVEIGHDFALQGIGSITPSAQLTIGRTHLDGFTDSTGAVVQSVAQRTKEARLGVTYVGALSSVGEGSSFRMSADYFTDLSPASEITVADTTLTSTGERNWFELGLGTTLVSGVNSRISLDAAYSFVPTNRINNNGLRASVGYKMQW